MIDIHTHILPAVDDGARNEIESLELIKEAKEAGFTSIVATSHYIEGYYEFDTKQREEIIKSLRCEENFIYNGAEAYVSENLVKLLKSSSIPTINNSRYVLFELPMNNKIMGLEDIIIDLKKNGYIPIIAHPERYQYVQENIEYVSNLIDMGVLFQGNYASIIGFYGAKAKKTFKILLKNKKIHFLATDVHRKESIYNKMNKIIRKIERVIGKEEMYKLSTLNPSKVIENKEL